LLEVDKLTAGYNGVLVVREASFFVMEGELVTLVGANGAGKTTLLKAISGLIKPHRGSIKFFDEMIHNIEAHKIVEKGLIQVPEGRKLFPDLSVIENLKLGAYIRNAKKHLRKNLENVFDLFPDLKEKTNQIAGTLSGGQQQMLAIGRGLMAEPKLLILDEPSIGLSPVLTQTLFSIITRIKEQGVTILLVEQNVKHSLSIADRGYVIEQGSMVMEGKGQELLHNEHLKKVYLGM